MILKGDGRYEIMDNSEGDLEGGLEGEGRYSRPTYGTIQDVDEGNPDVER